MMSVKYIVYIRQEAVDVFVNKVVIFMFHFVNVRCLNINEQQ